MSTVRLSFNEAMLNDSVLTNPSNYVITGSSSVTVSAVTVVSDRIVDLTVTGLINSGSYSITISNVKDLAGNVIAASYATHSFSTSAVLAPELTSATTIDTSTIRVVFSRAMSNTGLTTNGNYAFTCPAGATITVASITKISSTTVDIAISGEMRNGTDNYTVTVSNVTDLSGTGIDTSQDSDTFSGLGVKPRLSSAISTASDTVRLTFNEAMSDTGLTTNGNYAFTSPVGATITVGSVTKINSTTVDITISGEMLTGINNYSVTVINVVDAVGNIIDPDYDSDTFNGIGVAPQVASAAFVDVNTCTITFNEAVETTGAQLSSNYAITGPSSPNVTTATLVGNTVTLDLDADMLNGDYTITVSNVTDLAGNLVDPAHDDGTYTAAVEIPLILFGGEGDDGNDNETWKWNGTDWTQLTPAHSPPARRYHAACYDSARKVIIVFGGYIGGGGTNRANDTWEWNGIDWTQVSTAHSPTTRSDMALAYDANRGVTVLFGGYNGTVVNDETWEYNGVDWVQKFPAAKPSARCSYGMGYDPVYQKVLLLGGTNWISGSGQFWEYDGTNWTLKAANPLGTQQGMTFTYDTNRNITLFTHCWAISMGWNTYEYNYATNTWATYAPVPKPSKRYLAGFAYSPDELASILFGGYDGALDDETWYWDGTSWTQKLPAHSPSARYGHSLTAFGI